MNANPLFSVLIANYNNGKYLMEAINSVYAQTYTNWEIILVDDASTDNSKEIYKELEKDARIHIFYNDENHGCGYTKRRCAELANGELCGFLDADDSLLPEAIECHVNEHLKREHVSCVFSRYYNCDEKMDVVSELRLLQIQEGKNYFTNRNYMPEHFASFKKRDYDETDGISDDIYMGVDQDLYFKLEEISPVFVLDRFTYKYRYTNGISQGDNADVAFYWNIVVRHRTCMRRHLNPLEFSELDFVNYCKYKCELNVVKSLTYRVGNFFLFPFKFIKKLKK